MSSMYYKVNPQKNHATLYGFKKVSASEIHEITVRLARKTYNRHLSTSEEQKRVHNYENIHDQVIWQRTPSACARRTSVQSTRCRSASRLSDREMQRLLRRLMKPTESILNAQHDVDDRDKDIKLGRIVRSTSELDEKTAKSVSRLSRPTTASRAKSAISCHLCYDHQNKGKDEPLDVFDYEYADDKTLPEEEMQFVTERMLQSTCVSTGTQKICTKSPAQLDEVKIREQLPLVSGLRRSKNVKEIVNRLYPQPRYRMTPMATQVTVF